MKDLSRYNRQYILPQVGKNGQERLLESKVVVIGCGALGCQSSMLLARAGIGHIRIIDRDIVELDNLQRQILFDEGDVGMPKALVAMGKLGTINSDIAVEGLVDDVSFINVLDLIKDADVVVDGTDNMETRYLVNDACVSEGTPFVYGGAIATYGMAMPILPKRTACFRCLYPNPPPVGSLLTCDTAGILNTVPAVIASIQTTYALKIILESDIDSNLTLFDAWTNEFSEIRVKRSENCPTCSKDNFEFLNAEKKDIITSLCGRNAFSINPLNKGKIDLDILGKNLEKLGELRKGSSILVFKPTGSGETKYELTIFHDGRAIIKGTDDEKLAKSLYSRYVGH